VGAGRWWAGRSGEGRRQPGVPTVGHNTVVKIGDISARPPSRHSTDGSAGSDRAAPGSEPRQVPGRLLLLQPGSVQVRDARGRPSAATLHVEPPTGVGRERGDEQAMAQLRLHHASITCLRPHWNIMVDSKPVIIDFSRSV
jgi:hypothetical protein